MPRRCRNSSTNDCDIWRPDMGTNRFFRGWRESTRMGMNSTPFNLMKLFSLLLLALVAHVVALQAAEPDAPVLGQDAGRDWLDLLEAGDRDWDPVKAGFVPTGNSNVDYV